MNAIIHILVRKSSVKTEKLKHFKKDCAKNQFQNRIISILFVHNQQKKIAKWMQILLALAEFQ